jgi:hypothetical protein
LVKSSKNVIIRLNLEYRPDSWSHFVNFSSFPVNRSGFNLSPHSSSNRLIREDEKESGSKPPSRDQG